MPSHPFLAQSVAPPYPLSQAVRCASKQMLYSPQESRISTSRNTFTRHLSTRPLPLLLPLPHSRPPVPTLKSQISNEDTGQHLEDRTGPSTSPSHSFPNRNVDYPASYAAPYSPLLVTRIAHPERITMIEDLPKKGLRHWLRKNILLLCISTSSACLLTNKSCTDITAR